MAVGPDLSRAPPIMQFEKYMWIIEEAKSSAQTDFKIRIKFSNCIIGLACPLPDYFINVHNRVLTISFCSLLLKESLERCSFHGIEYVRG
ncbi:MAG: hypothetical protein ACJ795_14965, partial [Ktedonobacteraceae bacterium]